jgi:hypothetical protein
MKNLMAPNIPLALVLLAAVAAVALRAVARRPEAPGTAPAPVTVIAGQRQSQPQPAVTTGRHDSTGGEMARPPAHPGRPVRRPTRNWPNSLPVRSVWGRSGVFMPVGGDDRRG